MMAFGTFRLDGSGGEKSLKEKLMRKATINYSTMLYGFTIVLPKLCSDFLSGIFEETYRAVCNLCYIFHNLRSFRERGYFVHKLIYAYCVSTAITRQNKVN